MEFHENKCQLPKSQASWNISDHCDSMAPLMEASVHYGTARFKRMQETIVMQWNLKTPRLHCDTEGPHGTKETVRQWNLMEQSVNCQHSKATWKPGANRMLKGLKALCLGILGQE